MIAQKVTKKASEPCGSEPPTIHPGFLNAFTIHGLLITNKVNTFGVDRYFSIREKKRRGSIVEPGKRAFLIDVAR